jgi:hypothetical protein
MQKFKMRGLEAIRRAEKEFCDRVWYARCYLAMKEEIRSGKCKIVKHAPDEYREDIIDAEIWRGAVANAKRMEKKYGKKNLSCDYFDLGMIHGKLSALRWVLGLDCDDLGT